MMRPNLAQRLSHHHYQSYFVVSLLRVESGQPRKAKRQYMHD